MRSERLHVLIVDDDSCCLEEYCELVESIGYICKSARNANDALRLISADLSIGIVVTDLNMPGMDGLTLLNELALRFMDIRPLVAVVVTGDSSLGAAVNAMRSNAIDFLTKPVSFESLSLTLRRATASWIRSVERFQLSSLSRGGRQPKSLPGLPDLPETRAPRAQPSVAELQALAERITKVSRDRAKFFAPQFLSGPAWDILLDLALGGLKGVPVPTSSACTSTHVPFTTALRYVNQLVAAGFVKRELDQNDKRRTLLELEPHAFELMIRYFASNWDG